MENIGAILIILIIALPIIALPISIVMEERKKKPTFVQTTMENVEEKVRKRLLVLIKLNKIPFLNGGNQINSYLTTYDMKPYILLAKKQTDNKAIEVHRVDAGFFKGVTIHYSLTDKIKHEPLFIGDCTYTYTIVRIDNCMLNSESLDVKLNEV